MSDVPTAPGSPAVDRPAGEDSPASRYRAPLAALLLIVVAGVLWGLAWYWIAPLGATQVIDGGVYLKGSQELFASQDGWFAILGAIAGGLLAVPWPYLTRRSPVAGVVAGLVGSAVAGLLAWRIGTWLGPDSLKAQVHAGVKAPTTPLELHTPIAVLMAPMLFAAVRIVMETVAHFRESRRSAAPLPPADSAPQGVHVEQGQ